MNKVKYQRKSRGKYLSECLLGELKCNWLVHELFIRLPESRIGAAFFLAVLAVNSDCSFRLLVQAASSDG